LLGAGNVLVASGYYVRTDRAGAEVLAQVVGATGSEWHRKTTVERRDSIHPPSSNHCGHHFVASAQERLAVTERQVDPVIDDEIVREVLKAHRLFCVQVVVVLNDTLGALVILEAAGCCPCC
jgi:hypothetical protein